MDDILSGGKIDSSTSGPNPPNRDDRDRDILLEQKERQDQDALGGTQFPPRAQPLPPIPEAPEVAPPLPIIPSFDFSISGSALEETREIARQTVVDVLKNVTINGQGPSFEGSAISFNIPQQPPASEAFIFQGIMVPQPLPQVQPIQPTVLPLAQPEPAQEIQSFVVSPPPRKAEEQQETRPPQESAPPIVGPVQTPPTQKAQPVDLPETSSQEVEQPRVETQLPRQQSPQEVKTEPIQEPEASKVVTSISTPVAVLASEVRAEVTEAEEPERPVPPRITTATPPPMAEGEADERPPERPVAETQPAPEAPQPPSVEFPSVEFTEPEQPPTTMVESDVVLPPTDISIESFAPTPDPQRPQPAQPPETEAQREPTQQKGVDSEDFGTGGKEGFLKPAYTSLSGEKPEDGSQEIRDEARKRGADIDFYDAQKARDEARKAGADIDFDDAQAARDKAREEGAVARGFKEAEDRRDARREADPNFDRESSIRQRGESPTQFRERQEELKKERAEKEKQAEILKRAREGDISELPSGMVPVRLTRADGQKKILALMATEFVGVVEGADEGERTTSLPATDSYYEGGGGSTPAHPWKITIRTTPNSNTPTYQYAIESGSRLFDGFGGNEVEVIGADGVFRDLKEGYYFIEVNFSGGSLEIDQAEIKINEEMGSLIETDGDPLIQTKLRQQIGYVFFADNGSPQLRQNAWHNYSLFQTCRDSTPIKVTVAT